MIGSVTIITNKYIAQEAWKDRITSILGENLNAQLEIKTMTIMELSPGDNYYDDLIVIVPSSIETKVLRCIDSRAKRIIARRNLCLDNIHRVTDIPVGSEVLIVNDTYEYSMEIQKELETYGFTDFRYYIYGTPEADSRNFLYGITAGEEYLAPNIPQLVDLGQRQINMSTINEILSHFHDRVVLDDLIFNRYIANQIKASISLYNKTKDNELLHKYLISIIAEFDEGVFIFDSNNQILVSNNKVEEILGNSLDFDTLDALLPKNWDRMVKTDLFITYHEKPIYISLKPLSGSVNKSYMATITDIANVHTIDKKYKQYRTGSGLTAKYSFKDIITKSEVMEKVIVKAKKYARSDANILIMGESGTGKELLAQAIHKASNRSQSPFVAVNCGALSDALLESELFGYEEGAFTGASKYGKRGLFEIAHQGTLFLDEIGDAPKSIQQKLLRAIQEKEIFRVSGVKPIYVDVRIISATNKSLLEEVNCGDFRLDLFYRLNVMTLRLPTLRERPEDAEFLFKVLLNDQLKKNHLPWPEKQLNQKVYELIKSHNWPGNVRELENITKILAIELSLDSEANIYEEILAYWQTLGLDNVHQSNNRWRVSEKLQSSKELLLNERTEIVLSLLSDLERENKAPGRTGLLRHCKDNNIPLSEQQIKVSINKLKELGFLEQYHGYGNIITDKGRAYLDQMNTQKLFPENQPK
jgi:transcriptional regulator with PAS, ATPase and Fis domain